MCKNCCGCPAFTFASFFNNNYLNGVAGYLALRAGLQTLKHKRLNKLIIFNGLTEVEILYIKKKTIGYRPISFHGCTRALHFY
jgi:hypothetical protein